jgi:glucose/arabinose dehydrogenase
VRLETIGPYTADVGRDCDGRPYLSLSTMPGLCVGLVITGEHASVVAFGGRFRPRTLVEDPHQDGVFWVIDAGARRARAGRLFRLDTRGEVTIERVVDRLDRPHGSAIGPDGWLYVGEVQRIVRFDPTASDVAASREVVIDDLPTELADHSRLRFHPLTAFVFAPNFDLIVNMGSATDHCEESQELDRCHDEDDHTAAIWRFTHVVIDGAHRWSPEPSYVAHGLRNSVALAAHSSGTILQGENASDFSSPELPHEELNVIEAGRHYGWPYCYDADGRDPHWAHSSFACDASNPSYAPPHLLLPAHGAPLAMLYADDGPDALHGHLLIGLHGYRALGHRILALPVDAAGVPARTVEPIEVVRGWDASDTGPRGAPVGLTIARDGSIWTVEDTNGTVLRIAEDRYASARGAPTASAAPTAIDDAAFATLHRDVLRPRCAHCHEQLAQDPALALGAITREGWLREENGSTHLWERTRAGAPQRMPLDGALSETETEALRRWLAAR